MIEPNGSVEVSKLVVNSSRLELVGSIYAGSVESAIAGPITVAGSWLRSSEFDGSDICVVKGGGVAVTLRHPGGRVTLQDGGTFSIEGPQTIAESIRFDGFGVIQVSRSSLISPRFDKGSELELYIADDAEVTSVRGIPAVTLASGGSIAGDPKTSGLVMRSLAIVDHAEAVENINFFALDHGYLSMLDSVDRVSAWWPRRKEVRSRAREITCGVRSEASRPLARARYWLSVERLMKDKAATGRDLAVAHDVAEDSRRLVSSWKHVERWLLELSRVAGYGARIGLPLMLWAVGAGIFATLIRLLAGDLCTSGCSLDSSFGLYWDVLVAPVSFIRPVDQGSELRMLVADHVGARILGFGARAFGTWMLLSVALAIRRYIRTT